jgi:hypothetical protein
MSEVQTPAAAADGKGPALPAVQMSPEVDAALRAPFPAEQVGKLPRVWCRACTEADKRQRGTTCGDHERKRCDVCGVTLTTGHLHLDYVGHAATTQRLLEVDPRWTWEPFAIGPDGLPALTRGGELWIWLTVAGVRRPGVGDQSNGKGSKELIGDAIRNAAMRFGVALELWSKQDLRQHELADAAAAAADPRPEPDAAAGGAPAAAGGRPAGGRAPGRPAARGRQTGSQRPQPERDARPITDGQVGHLWGYAGKFPAFVDEASGEVDERLVHQVVELTAGVRSMKQIQRWQMDRVKEAVRRFAEDPESAAGVVRAWYAEGERSSSEWTPEPGDAVVLWQTLDTGAAESGDAQPGERGSEPDEQAGEQPSGGASSSSEPGPYGADDDIPF